MTIFPVTSFYFQGLRKCFLEISICLEVLLAALFISISNRYQKKTTLQPLYNTVHYNRVLDITRFKDGSQKCIDYIEKWPFMVIFQYNLYIFVWIWHSCLTNMVYVIDPNNSVYKEVVVYLSAFRDWVKRLQKCVSVKGEYFEGL